MWKMIKNAYTPPDLRGYPLGKGSRGSYYKGEIC